MSETLLHALPPLLDRAERLLGAHRCAPVREAYRSWQRAPTLDTKPLVILCNGALVGALEAHLAGSQEGALAMLDVFAATTAEEQRFLRGSQPQSIRLSPKEASMRPALNPSLSSDEAPSPIVEEEALSIERYPLARCAAIAASIAHRKDRKMSILDKHELTLPQWAELEQHWSDAIRIDNQAGSKGRLLAEYDEAYVAQLEVERGRIDADTYAKLVVATERGTEAQTLKDLDLPRGALARIQRIWLRKLAEDKTLDRRVRAAIDG